MGKGQAAITNTSATSGDHGGGIVTISDSAAGKKTREIKSINFTKNFFDQIPFFCNFRNGQKSIYELGQSLKLPEMQFHEKEY